MSSPNLPWGAPAPEVPPPPPPFGPPPADTADAPGKRMSLGTKLFFVLAALILVAIVAGFAIHVPYSTISPGSNVRLTNAVTIDKAKTYPTPRGDFRLLFVREQNHLNLWQFLAAQFQSDTDVLKEKDVTGGKSPQQVQREGQDEMTRAKEAATNVALTAAGYRVPAHIVVNGLDPKFPAIKVLRLGDLITQADGQPVSSMTDLRRQVGRHAPGDRVTLLIERDGRTMSVQVPVATTQDGHRAIGISDLRTTFDFPFPVAVDTSSIGGPSGGLAMTLAIYDELTPGDLAGGNRVAVTGTIDADGNVGEIGGIVQKAVDARDAGARLFIVPRCNKELDDPKDYAGCQKKLVRAAKRAGSKVKVVPVSTFQEALQVLRDNGGDPPA